jgi:ubiquinone/menaquinone biosynthesis C-methylase UbiE
MQNCLPGGPLNEAIQNRVRTEQREHSNNDVLSKSYQLKNRFKHIWIYPSRRRMDRALLEYLEKLNGKRVLDYGCGWGDSSLYMLDQGAEVHGIDISNKYIDAARKRCHEAGYHDSKFGFYVMDAHNLGFADDSFDSVVGLGILHHLEFGAALKEIHRVLKPNGRALFQEPLAGNPMLKLFRMLTPKARTENEIPLGGKDLSHLRNSSSWNAEMCFCGIIEAPAAMVTSMLMPARNDNFLLRAADFFEKKMHAHSFLNSWNQYVLLNLSKIPGQ